MCTCMSYRNPAYLAKVAATIDIISGGRVEMGIGAGWYEHEWRAYGYGFPSRRRAARPARRGRPDHAADLWTTGTATPARQALPGRRGHRASRCPLQEGGIPMWIAGGGEKVTLRIAAEYADYTNFDGAPEGVRAQERDAARATAPTSAATSTQIVRSANYNVVIGETEQEVQDRLDWIPRPLPQGRSVREGRGRADGRPALRPGGGHARADRREPLGAPGRRG